MQPFDRSFNNVSSTQVIIAALNEEEGIGPTISELKQYLGETKLLVVDGNSVDRTVELAQNLGAVVLFQDGAGKGNAFAKAIQHIDSSIDYVIITDADFTYPAKYIPEMIKTLEKNLRVGMVCGNRFTDDLTSQALQDLFYVGNRIIAFTHNLLNGINLADPLTGLRVVRADILRGWKMKSKGFDMEVELNHLVEREGFAIVEVPIQYRPRLGEKKLGILHGAEILKRIILETTY